MFYQPLLLFLVGSTSLVTGHSTDGLTPGDSSHSTTTTGNQVARDCEELQHTSPGALISGVYLIQPLTYATPFNVYCDFKTDGGGWTVFQRRVDGSVNFHRGWADYKKGFGNLKTEFWLGNEKISTLTAQKKYQLRIELTGETDTPRYAKYSSFRLGPEDLYYQLFLGSYSGDAGQDSLNYHRRMYFSTHDADHDQHVDNCASINKSGWWFKACDRSNLNGDWLVKDDHGAIEWINHPGGSFGLRYTEMKIRAA